MTASPAELGRVESAGPRGGGGGRRLEPPGHSERFHFWFGLAVVLVLAVLPRAWAVWHTEVIQRDGVTFIRYARLLTTDPSAAVAQFDQHVGYPWLLKTVHAAVAVRLAEPDGVEGWELSGQLVSLVAGVLATLGVWAWAGLAIDWRVAWVGAGMFAVGRKWAMLGADVMSDATALALWVWAVVGAVWLAKRQSACGGTGARLAMWRAGLLAGGVGALAGAAYLVRPEGLGALVVAWVVWTWGWMRGGAGLGVGGLGRWGGMLVVSGVAAAAVAGPYMAAIGGLTKKKAVGELIPVSLSVPAEPALLAMGGPARDFATPLAVVAQTVEAIHPVVFGWVGVWAVLLAVHVSIPRSWRLAFLRWPRGPGAVAVWTTVVLYAVVAARLHLTAGYLDWRHCMALAFALVPLAGAGLLAVVDFFAVLASPLRLKSLTVPRFVAWQWAWVFPVVLVATGWQSFRPLHAHNSYVMAAAERLQSELPGRGDGFIVTNLPWVLHYAQRPGKVLDTWRLSNDDAMAALEAMGAKVTHVVVSERWLGEDASPLTQRLTPPAYELLEVIPQRQGQDRLWLYRVRHAGAWRDLGGGCAR